MDGLRARGVACGGSHTLIITLDDQLYACGAGNLGELGHNHQSFFTPTHIPLPFTPLSVHCAICFSVVKATDGTLWSTGYNSYGQLGLGDTVNRSEFTQIPGIVSTQVACGWSYVVVVDEQCRLWGWGPMIHPS